MAKYMSTLRFDPLLSIASPRFMILLVGQVQGHQICSLPVLLRTLSGQWSHLQNFPVVERVYANTFVFSFQNEEDRRAVEIGTWNVLGNLLALRRWDEMCSLRELRFEYATLWIQLHNLPPYCSPPEISCQIAAMAGEVQEVDLRCLSSARVRVLVNILAPLTAGLYVPRSGRITDCWVYFKYERLPNFCYRCGRLSHSTAYCMYDEVPAIIAIRVDLPLQPYGPWLRADDPNFPLLDFHSPIVYDEAEQEEAMGTDPSSQSGSSKSTSNTSLDYVGPTDLDIHLTADGQANVANLSWLSDNCDCETCFAGVLGVDQIGFIDPPHGLPSPEYLRLRVSPTIPENVPSPYPEGLTLVENDGECYFTWEAGPSKQIL